MPQAVLPRDNLLSAEHARFYSSSRSWGPSSSSSLPPPTSQHVISFDLTAGIPITRLREGTVGQGGWALIHRKNWSSQEWNQWGIKKGEKVPLSDLIPFLTHFTWQMGRSSHPHSAGRVQVWLDQMERRGWMANTSLRCLNWYRCEVCTPEAVTSGCVCYRWREISMYYHRKISLMRYPRHLQGRYLVSSNDSLSTRDCLHLSIDNKGILGRHLQIWISDLRQLEHWVKQILGLVGALPCWACPNQRTWNPSAYC